MEQEKQQVLRTELETVLGEVCQLPEFGALAELLQGEALVLRYLAGHREETVYPSDLSLVLRLSRPRITGALRSLHRKGLLRLAPCLQDKRRIRVSITEAGLARIDRQLAEVDSYFDRMIAGLGEEDTRTLNTLIRRCVDIMQTEEELP